MADKVDAPTGSDSGSLAKDNGTGPKAIIKNVDMSEELQQEAVDVASAALEKYNIEKDIAAQIKKEFDKRHGPTWHVVVGKNFGSYVTHGIAVSSVSLPPIARINAPYSWSFLPNTFLSDGPLSYTASVLPDWLSFDPATRTFSGTPSANDGGTPKITVTASTNNSSDSDSASSPLTLCLHIPIEQQFDAKNPSLSSVFVIRNSSSLHGSRPALRVPPKWSFSIGLYYAARQVDGSPLPDWIDFNERAITFNGVTPPPQNLTGPHVVSLKGYSAATVEFDLVVAAHDFSLVTDSLPTINFTLNSAVDFSGVLIDGESVAPSNITSLDIDTYDAGSKTLSGEPPSDFTRGVLPVILTSSVNQTLHTDVALAAVPSFFSTDNLAAIMASPGDTLTFDLDQYFSNNSGLGKGSDVELTAVFDPLESGDYLSFDSGSSTLTGTIPRISPYSHVTHSTSHATLPISLSSSDYKNQHNKSGGHGLSPAARRKLMLGLKIAFGIICGFVGIAIIFAVLRRCTRVPDTAIMGEEGGRAWTADEKRWYGIGIEVNGEKYSPSPPSRGYGWSEGIVTRSSSNQQGDGIGATVSRVLTRTLSNISRNRSPLSPVGHPQSPTMIKKVEFVGKVRATARLVSDKYRRVVSGPKRPTISKPTLILTSERGHDGPSRTDIDGLPLTNPAGLLSVRDLRMGVLDDSAMGQYAPSGLTGTSMTNSPSSSTDARSIPRRRADFAPPKVITTPPEAHLEGTVCRSLDSLADSLATDSSTRTHEAEAVVQRATRAASVLSFPAVHHSESPMVLETARPRLVPFTSAARVPVPKMPSSFFSPDSAAGATTKRVVSQMAKVFRGSQYRESEVPVQALAQVEGESADELTAGIEYVRALGDDGRSSLSSSHHGHGRGGRAPVVPAPRMLARTGERFKFRVPVSAPAPPSPTLNTSTNPKRASLSRPKDLEVRLLSGRPLPKFFRVNLDGVPSGLGARAGDVGRRVVELWGVPVRADCGEYEIGVYAKEGGERVGRVLVEVVERKSG
ncbi:hypothetical protein C8Q74DRAFT_1314648 [Fomes fomentarius]|nr:hypothetical protein C8Q74DRAFT_1314648 [Fomes fomentarius]